QSPAPPAATLLARADEAATACLDAWTASDVAVRLCTYCATCSEAPTTGCTAPSSASIRASWGASRLRISPSDSRYICGFECRTLHRPTSWPAWYNGTSTSDPGVSPLGSTT